MNDRQDNLQRARGKSFDLVIIGGGISGAGVAQNAAARGMSVLLLERGDFASGASSKSKQLLQAAPPRIDQLPFNLNRQASEERDRLRRIAPHLVKEVSFVLPLVRNNTLFNFKAALGVGLNDVMAMSSGQGANTHLYLSQKKLANLAPAISEDYVAGGIQFQDAMTDDARLVISVLKSATELGAVVLNYVAAAGFCIEDSKITGVKCHDRYSGEEFSVDCKFVVNASGVWTDEVSSLAGKAAKKSGMTITKCTQLIISSSALETNSALLLPAKDGRFVYILPWHHVLLVGSAETAYSGALDQSFASKSEIDYLLSVINSYLDGQQRLNASDVKSSFSGLMARVPESSKTAANKSEGKNESNYSIYESSAGMICALGLRLSNYRLVAQEVIDKIAAKSPGICKKQANTDSIILGGWSSKDDFLAQSASSEVKAKRLSIEPASIRNLIANYGNQAEDIIDLVEKQPDLSERIIPDFPIIMAEIPFAIINEMTISLQDFMLRRSRLAVISPKQAMEAAPRVAEMMAQTLGWDSHRTQLEISALESELFDQSAVVNKASK